MAHEELQLLYELDGRETETPWRRWEAKVLGTDWDWVPCVKAPVWDEECQYRRLSHLTPPGVTTAVESDPHGKSPHESGAKLDAGKPRVGLVLLGFPHALMEVAKVGTFGAGKYTDNGWKDVPNGQQRYTDAMLRHLLKEAQGEVFDNETGIAHAAHAAWNALARLELELTQLEVHAPQPSATE